MINDSEKDSNVFLDRNIENLDLGIKKLLLLDYMIYYNEKQPNEKDIKGLSSGKIPIDLKTKNTVDPDGTIGLFPKVSNQNFQLLPTLKKRKRENMDDSEYEDLEESHDEYSLQNDEDDDGNYNKMMREIDDEIQEQMMRDMLSERNNKIDEQDFMYNKGYRENLKNMEKDGNDEEWEDVDNLEGEQEDDDEESPLDGEEENEEDQEWDEEEEMDFHQINKKKYSLPKNKGGQKVAHKK